MNKIDMMGVRSLEVQHFRGISTKKTIDLSKKFTILWGENGTGKSSFVNALEYLFTENLQGFNIQTIKKKDAFIHKGSNEEDLEIVLTFDGNLRYIKNINNPYPKKVIQNFLTDNESFLKSASFILTRRKLLEFIESTPTNKYKSIIQLCGFSKIEELKKEFNNAKLHYKRLLDEINTNLKKSTSELNNILDTNLDTKDEFISKINEIISHYNFDLIDGETDFDKYLINLNFKDFDVKNNIQNFNSVYSKINIVEFVEMFNSILKEYEKINLNAVINLDIYQNLLKKSKEYLEKNSPSYCPVCNSKINSEEITLEIDEKLEDMSQEISSIDIWKENLNGFKTKSKNIIENLEKLNRILSDLSLDLLEFDYLNKFMVDLNRLYEFKASAIDLNDKYDFKDLQNVLNHAKMLVDNKDDSLMNDGEYQKISELKSILNEFKSFCELTSQKKELNSKFEVVMTILNAYDKTKREFINDIIYNIQDDIKRYYKFLHGDDLINSPELTSNGNRVELSLDSFGDKTDPRQFSSEGHIDSLGLCIFLAFVKEYNPLKLIVLDDIITTVDFSHKYKILLLLIEEFEDFNFLITTHNGLWVDQIKNLCRNYNMKYEEVYISNWSITEGPIFRKKLSYPELIKKYLDDAEFPAAVNTARQYLEFSTYTFCSNHEVSIKILDRYELGQLCSACREKSIKKSKDERIKELWNELFKNYFIVNKLSHFNNDVYCIHSGEIKHLCKIVLELCPKLIKM